MHEVTVDLSHFAGCIKSLGTLEKNVLRQSWGSASSMQSTDISMIPVVEDLTEDMQVSEGAHEGSTSETTSASETTSSSSDETSGEATEDAIHIPEEVAKQLEWIAPLRSKFLHCRRRDAPLEVDAALCTGRIYALGYTTGQGIATAPTTSRMWCSSCLAKATSETRS